MPTEKLAVSGRLTLLNSQLNFVVCDNIMSTKTTKPRRKRSNLRLLPWMIIGTAIAGGIGIFLYRRNILPEKNLNVFDLKDQTVVASKEINASTTEKNGLNSSLINRENSITNRENNIPADSTDDKTSNKETEENRDSIFSENKTILDGNIQSSSDEFHSNDSSVVLHDEMLSDTDLIITALPGEQPNPTAAHTLKVEFWRSPIHFKGYKLFRNKLMLYGIKDIEDIQLFSSDDMIYMKVKKKVYVLTDQNAFSAMQMVKDKNIINFFK